MIAYKWLRGAAGNSGKGPKTFVSLSSREGMSTAHRPRPGERSPAGTAGLVKMVVARLMRQHLPEEVGGQFPEEMLQHGDVEGGSIIDRKGTICVNVGSRIR